MNEDRLVVVWRVTERCNLQCPFCAYDRRLDFARPRREMDADEVRRVSAILADWSAHTGRPVLLSWLGGEPLAWRNLEALSRQAHQDLGLALSTTTNGTGLTQPAMLHLLHKCFAELTISIDGPAAYHDALRGRRGTFDRARQGINELAQWKRLTGQGPLLRANVVLMRSNVADFPALCETLADWGIEEITCNQLGGRDRPEFYPANRLLPNQVDWLTEHWRSWQEALDRRGIRLLGGASYLHRLRLSAQDLPYPVADCHPGSSFLFIDETGKVSPCSFTTAEYGVPLASLHTVADLMHLAQSFSLNQLHHRAAACDDCLSTQVCTKFTAARSTKPTTADLLTSA